MGNRVIRPYAAPAEVLALTPEARIDRAVEQLRARHGGLSGGPVEEQALLRLEADLGVPLPDEFRRFVARYGWLLLGNTQIVGVGVAEAQRSTPLAPRIGDFEQPWISDEHAADRSYLVIGAIAWFADGEQLLIDLASPHPVIAYLHEDGPAFDEVAPSFSLALYRIATEAPLLTHR